MLCFLHIGKCLKRVQSSPLELLNGRCVSGPMAIINELWAQDKVKQHINMFLISKRR